MGTSSNSKGSSARSPLVPPHADSQPGKPVPPRPENGLANFRRSLTSYMKSGSNEHKERALGRYARQAVGGSSVGVRRFGAVANSGSATIGTLLDLASGGTGEASSGSDVSSAIGAPIVTAAQIIAQAVSPDNSEGDGVRIMVEDAICEALQDYDTDTLERDSITEEFLSDVIFNFTVEAILQDMLGQEGSPSLDAVENAQALQAREADLRATIYAAVDAELSSTNGPTLTTMTSAQRRSFQLDCVQSVLSVFEGLPE